jgi:SAM-dependent methyltransferase
VPVSESDLYHEAAWLYDAAFSWESDEENDWLVERFGPGARRVLEPACGAGRMFRPLAARGLSVVGLDLSEAMLERARARIRELRLEGVEVRRADITDFDLGEVFDAAVCPINSLAHLTGEDDLARHLACVARHLRPGARYLAMVDLRSPTAPRDLEPSCGRWEVEDPRGGATIECRWSGGAVDPETRLETQTSTFTIRGGPEDGRVHRFAHVVRTWDWPTWRAVIAASPFDQAAAHDGNASGQPELPLGPGLENRNLVWHELVRAPLSRDL